MSFLIAAFIYCSVETIKYLCAVMQTFLKVVNYQHLMPTRYTLDVDLKSLVTADVVDNSSKRIEVRKVCSKFAPTKLFETGCKA